MTTAELSRRAGKVVGYPPPTEMSAEQRRDFHEALLEADAFEDLPGKWQAAILKAEQSRPKLRLNVGQRRGGRIPPEAPPEGPGRETKLSSTCR